MKFALTSILLGATVFAKSTISTIYGPMDLLALSTNYDINNKVVYITSSGVIGVGGTAPGTKNFTVTLDTTDRGLYSLETAPIDGQVSGVYLSGSAWKLSTTEKPLSPFGFSANSYITVDQKQQAYACKENVGYSLHWGGSPTCTNSVKVTLQALFHAEY